MQLAYSKSSARGFSMIELLVAVLVMGIGVLGIAGLQMVSLQNNRGALERAEAVQLAYNVLDRVRSNPGTGVVPGANYAGVNIAAAPPAFVDCQAANCTSAQMVNYDLAIWKCSLGGWDTDQACIDARAAGALWAATLQPGLPNGDGAIVVNNATGIISVTVQWQPPKTPNALTITIESQG